MILPRSNLRRLSWLLIPGLSLKRWIGIGAIGLLSITVGILFAQEIPTASAFISFLQRISLMDEAPFLRGAVFVGIGVVVTLIAASGLARSLGGIQRGNRQGSLLDSLYVQRVLGSGPKIALIGGGSGMPGLLRGLKNYTSNITAIVTMADDGGSSGRLRTELGIQPPGDIRNCLVALADSETVMQELMDYRFSSNGQLDGHSFGNMLIAALTGIGGSFSHGVEVASDLLAVRGRVVPSTTTDVTLVGSTTAGETLVGETNVASAPGRRYCLSLDPPHPAGHPEAVNAIREADLIVIGPGSLFTSIVPNLLIRDIALALSQAAAFKIYVCNVAEEPLQTEGFSVTDHLNVVRHYGGAASVDAVVANNNIPLGPTPAGLDYIAKPEIWDDPALLIKADVIDEVMTARHDSRRVTTVIAESYANQRGRVRWARLLRLDFLNGGRPAPAAARNRSSNGAGNGPINGARNGAGGLRGRSLHPSRRDPKRAHSQSGRG